MKEDQVYSHCRVCCCMAAGRCWLLYFGCTEAVIFECYSYCWHGFDCARHSATCGRRRGSRMASIASLRFAPAPISKPRIASRPGRPRVCPETTHTLLRRAAVSAPRTMRREFCPNADACVRSFEALGRDRAARRSQLGGIYRAASLRPVGCCPARSVEHHGDRSRRPPTTTRRSRRTTTPPSAPSRTSCGRYFGALRGVGSSRRGGPGPAPAEAPACITDDISVASLRMELQTEPWFDAKQRGDPAATVY